MINIVQVYPYITKNGCSVRIGRGYDINEPLEPSSCVKYVFVETKEEVKDIINVIKKLSPECRTLAYRGKMESIEKLKTYVNSINH